MSSELFESREDDFQSLYETIQQKVENKLKRSSGEEKKKCVRDVRRGLEEATLLIHEMEDEVKRAPPKYRTPMLTRIRSYKQDLQDIEKQLTTNADPVNRMNTFTPEQRLQTAESAQRGRLVGANASLGRASASIARSQQVAAETDEIGAGIINELDDQRESLVRTRDRLSDTDNDLKKSRKILQTMARRIMTNKLILIAIIIMELGILAGVVYWKFFS